MPAATLVLVAAALVHPSQTASAQATQVGAVRNLATEQSVEARRVTWEPRAYRPEAVRSLMIIGVQPATNARIRPLALSAGAVASPREVQPREEQPREEHPWLAYDKLQHAAFAFLLTVSAAYVFGDKLGASRSAATGLGAATGTAAGLVKETYDWRIAPSRRFDGRDLVADLVGVALGTALILL